MNRMSYNLLLGWVLTLYNPPITLGQAITTLGSTTITSIGTTQTIGKLDRTVVIDLKVEGPVGQKTPLQVACLFEYVEGDIFKSPPALPRNLNGMVQLDDALLGLLTDLRKSGRFRGHALETLLLTIPSGVIPAQKLLLIGLGDQAKFTPDLMGQVAIVGFREAVRLGVDSFSHASDLKDAGLDSPTAEVAKQIIAGLANAYQTQLYLQQKKFSPTSSVCKITILTGPAFFEATKQAIIEALEALPTN